MIYLDEIQETVNESYLTLADIQYDVSVREPVQGDVKIFNDMYFFSTKIVAFLDYLNILLLNVDTESNLIIENIIISLKELNSKAKLLWH